MFDFEKRSQLINLLYDKKFEKFDIKKTLEQIVIETKKIVIVAQKVMKQKVVVVIETTKFEIDVKNINFFDFFMMMNLSKLHFFVNCANFFQKLNEQSIKYQENNVLKTLKTNFRDFVLK